MQKRIEDFINSQAYRDAEGNVCFRTGGYGFSVNGQSAVDSLPICGTEEIQGQHDLVEIEYRLISVVDAENSGEPLDVTYHMSIVATTHMSIVATTPNDM